MGIMEKMETIGVIGIIHNASLPNSSSKHQSGGHLSGSRPVVVELEVACLHLPQPPKCIQAPDTNSVHTGITHVRPLTGYKQGHRSKSMTLLPVYKCQKTPSSTTIVSLVMTHHHVGNQIAKALGAPTFSPAGLSV